MANIELTYSNDSFKTDVINALQDKVKKIEAQIAYESRRTRNHDECEVATWHLQEKIYSLKSAIRQLS